MDTVRKFGKDASFLWRFARNGDFSTLAKIAKSQVWSDIDAIGSSFDMTQPYEPVASLFPMKLRPARDEDLELLLATNVPGLDPDDREERLVRQHMRTLGFLHCVVVVNEEDQPCFLQWLILSSENAVLAEAYHGLYPPLKPHQALVEGAYIPPAFRGKKVMPAAKRIVCEYARDFGVTEVITFVRSTNIASLKGCQRAGFVPVMTRVSSHRFGRSSLTFKPLAPGTPYPFETSSRS